MAPRIEANKSAGRRRHACEDVYAVDDAPPWVRDSVESLRNHNSESWDDKKKSQEGGLQQHALQLLQLETTTDDILQGVGPLRGSRKCQPT